MKIRHLIWLGAGAYAGYKLYNKRHILKEDFRLTKASFDQVQDDWTKVQHNLTKVTQQLPVLETVISDLGYKTQVFQKEMEARLAQMPLTSESQITEDE